MIIEKRWTRDKLRRHYIFNSSQPYTFTLSGKDEITLTPHRRFVTKTSRKTGTSTKVWKTDGWIINDPWRKLRFTRYDQKFNILHEAQLFVQEYSNEIVKELGR